MKNNRILLVDDDEVMLKTFQLILEEEGYLVETSTNGQNAIDKVNKNNFNLIILDIVLPDVRGDEIAKKIKRISRTSKIIFITGYSKFKKEDSLDINFETNIILKPITVKELKKIIKKELPL